MGPKFDEMKLKQEYDKLKPFYKEMGENIKKSLEKILINNDISILGVSCRIKEFDSFLRKIERKKYDNPFEEINDICGLRIIYFYPSDFRKISDLIRFEFNVEEIVDNFDSKDPDRFGYLSNHFIVQLNERWLIHPLLRPLRGYKAEIQVRTVLMHAWADISHQLIYKNEENIPDHLKRRLNRISALFEIADEQFDTLIEEKENYVKSIMNNDSLFDITQELNIDSFSAFLDYIFPDRECSEEDNFDVLDSIQFFNKKNQYKDITFKELLEYYKEYEGIIMLEEKYSEETWNQADVLRRIMDMANKDYHDCLTA